MATPAQHHNVHKDAAGEGGEIELDGVVLVVDDNDDGLFMRLGEM